MILCLETLHECKTVALFFQTSSYQSLLVTILLATLQLLQGVWTPRWSCGISPRDDHSLLWILVIILLAFFSYWLILRSTIVLWFNAKCNVQYMFLISVWSKFELWSLGSWFSFYISSLFGWWRIWVWTSSLSLNKLDEPCDNLVSVNLPVRKNALDNFFYVYMW